MKELITLFITRKIDNLFVYHKKVCDLTKSVYKRMYGDKLLGLYDIRI